MKISEISSLVSIVSLPLPSSRANPTLITLQPYLLYRNYPDLWKHATVCFIAKNNPSESINYHVIALILKISKMIETAINNDILFHLKSPSFPPLSLMITALWFPEKQIHWWFTSSVTYKQALAWRYLEKGNVVAFNKSWNLTVPGMQISFWNPINSLFSLLFVSVAFCQSVLLQCLMSELFLALIPQGLVASPTFCIHQWLNWHNIQQHSLLCR